MEVRRRKAETDIEARRKQLEEGIEHRARELDARIAAREDGFEGELERVREDGRRKLAAEADARKEVEGKLNLAEARLKNLADRLADETERRTKAEAERNISIFPLIVERTRGPVTLLSLMS